MKSQKKQNLAILVSESISQDGKLIDLARTFDSEVSMQEFYDSFGYVTIKNAIPIDLLSEIQHDLECIFSPFATDERNPVDSAIMELDKNDKARLYEITLAASKLNSIKAVGVHLNQLFPKFTNNKNPVMEIESTFMLSIPNDKRLVVNFHQESNYIRDFAGIINIHFPIFRTSNIENGTMSLIPSSHSNGTLTFEKNRFSDDSYTDLVPSKIEEITSELPELHCQLDLGDCVFFNKDLIHRSNHNNSKLCRPVGVSRFTQSLTGDWVHRISADL